MHKRFFLQVAAAAVALGLAAPGRRPAMEADQADQPDRAVGRRRLDRPDDARHRGRTREGAGPEDHRGEPARRLGLDRHARTRWEAPKDGYTWTAGAAQDLGTYQALGMLDVPAKDWHLFLSVANIAVVGVGAADALPEHARSCWTR